MTHSASRTPIGFWSLDTPAEVIATQLRAAVGPVGTAELRAMAVAVVAAETGWVVDDRGLLVDADGKRYMVVARTLKPGARAASFTLGDRDWDGVCAAFVDRATYRVFGWITVTREWADRALHPKQTSVRLTWHGSETPEGSPKLTAEEQAILDETEAQQGRRKEWTKKEVALILAQTRSVGEL